MNDEKLAQPTELPDNTPAELVRGQLEAMMARRKSKNEAAPTPPEPNQHPAILSGMYRNAGLPRRAVKWIEKHYAEEHVMPEAAKIEALLDEGKTTVVLSGGPGTGKTCVAVERSMRDIRDGRRVRYIALADLCDLLEEARQHGGEEGVEFVSVARAVAAFREYDLLVIDELQSGRETDAAIRNLSTIVTGRHDNLRPTLLITNADAAQMPSVLANPVLDRAVCIAFSGPSFRDI